MTTPSQKRRKLRFIVLGFRLFIALLFVVDIFELLNTIPDEYSQTCLIVALGLLLASEGVNRLLDKCPSCNKGLNVRINYRECPHCELRFEEEFKAK